MTTPTAVGAMLSDEALVLDGADGTQAEGAMSMTATAHPRASSFHVSWVRESGVWWLHLHGELDVASSDLLDALIDDLTEPIVFDCADLTFIDGAGLGSLAAARRAGDAIVLVNPSKQLRRLLEIEGVAELLRLAPERIVLPSSTHPSRELATPHGHHARAAPRR